MLVQLTALQVTGWWDVFAPHIESTLPAFARKDAEALLNIKTSLLDGTMLMWVLLEEEQRMPYAFVLTSFTEDQCSRGKNLLIYCLYGYKQVPTNIWLKGWDTLKAFAKASGCLHILAYTNVPRVIEIAQQLNMHPVSTMLLYEVATEPAEINLAQANGGLR